MTPLAPLSFFPLNFGNREFRARMHARGDRGCHGVSASLSVALVLVQCSIFVNQHMVFPDSCSRILLVGNI